MPPGTARPLLHQHRGGAPESRLKLIFHAVSAFALTPCINDKLIDDDDMARQRKHICSGQCIGTKVLYVYTETVRISLFKSSCSSYTSSLWCNYRSESLRKLCVAYNNFDVFRKITFLPRDCSASLMFATRDLPTCKILIRKHA